MPIEISLNPQQYDELNENLINNEDHSYSINSYVGLIEFLESRGMMKLTNDKVVYIGDYKNSELLSIVYKTLIGE